jgi:protein-disulfide isomerase
MISDFQCPYCKQWHDASMEQVKRDYVAKGHVRLAYLNLPLPQHRHARAEAEAALCAGVQDQFWPFAERLFARQESLEKVAAVQPVLDTIARGLSMDMAAFGRCQQRQAIRALVESDIQQAGKTGVRSTPSFLVGEFLVEGAVPYPEFRKAIDTALVLARRAKRTR